VGDGGNYRLGAIWLVKFDPSIGTEIRKTRPAVIVSDTPFNIRSKVVVLPITSATPKDPRLLQIWVPVSPSQMNGLDRESFIVCVDPATFDKRRLVQYLGQIEIEQIEKIKAILARLLNLP
jgi:mRNA interferase MazF